MKGVIKIHKNTSSVRNHVLRGHGNKFTSFLSFLEFQNKSQPDDASELSDDGIRKGRNDSKVSVGGRLSDYLIMCHPYGEKHPKEREFEVNIVALMAHAFTFLSLVDHDCFRNLTQDIDPCLCSVGRSKMLRSLIPTKKKLAEKSVI